MNQSAAYYYANDTSVNIATGPTLLIAVLVTADGGGAVVTVKDGAHDTGATVAYFSLADATSVNFCPASPIALKDGLSVIASEMAFVTLVYA